MATVEVDPPNPSDGTEALAQASETQDLRKQSVGGRDLVKGIAILWSLQIVFGVSLAICFLVLSFTGLSSRTPFELATSPIVFAVATPITFCFVLLVSWWFVCRKYGKSFREGFAIVPVQRRTVLISIGLGLGGACVAGILSHFFSTGKSLMSDLAATPFGWSTMVVLALIGPAVEEIYYRGFIYPSMRKAFGGVTAVLVVALWFGAAHSLQLAGDWIGVPIVMAMGAIWTLQRHYSQSLIPSTISHWFYNFGILVITGITSSS